MQRWIKLPDGRFIDANRIAYVGKVESYLRSDEEGHDLGPGYAVNIGTDIPRESQFTLTGGKDEVFATLREILDTATAAAPEVD